MNHENLHDVLIRATDAIESPGLAEGTVLLARKRRRQRLGALTVGGTVAAVTAVLLAVSFVGERASRSADPVDRQSAGDTALNDSQTWLATHDYRLIAQLRGPSIINVTVVRTGDLVRGDVQTMDAAEARQTGYYRFRIGADHVVTATTGALGNPDWQPATPSQRDFLTDIADPLWMLAPLESPGLRDYGRTGDAEMYRDSDGDSLFMIGGRPFRVVTHGRTDDWTRTFTIDLRRAAKGKTATPEGGVKVAVSSHCGVHSLIVDGSLWLADPPLGGHNPPPGWDENETSGFFVRTGQSGEFHGDGGQRAHFRLASAGEEDPNAGCE